MSLRLFYSNDHKGHYPVGACSIVLAHDEAEARTLLDAELSAHGLLGHGNYTLVEVAPTEPTAYVLLDGNY